MTGTELRRVADEVVARRPLPARELSALDPALRPALVWGALHHPDPPARRLCLDYLDHLAGPDTVGTLVAALDDPVPRVRRHAVHALSCEACKPGAWCVDAVTPLRRLVARDPSPKVRFEALRALLGRLEPPGRGELIDAVAAGGDRPLLDEVRRARPGAVPADLRARVVRRAGW